MERNKKKEKRIESGIEAYLLNSLDNLVKICGTRNYKTPVQGELNYRLSLHAKSVPTTAKINSWSEASDEELEEDHMY